MAEPSGPTVAGDPEDRQGPPAGADVEAPAGAPAPPWPTAEGVDDHVAPDAAAVDTGPPAVDEVVASSVPVEGSSAVGDPPPAAVGSEEPAAEVPADGPPAPVDDVPPTGAKVREPDADADAGDENDSVADPARDGDDDLDEDDDDAGKPRRGGLLTKQVQVDAKMIVIFALVLALLGGAYYVGRDQAQEAVSTGTTPKATNAPGSPIPKDFVPFEDKEAGVKLSLPKDWEPRSTVNLGPTTRMLRSVPNTSDALIMRVNSYAGEVTAANLIDQKNVFDAALADQKIKLLVNEALPTGLGLPALVYVYQFTDEATGVTGVHSRYVFFQGRKVVTLLFQALPEDHYKTLGPIWDSIVGSLQVAPGPPPAFAEQYGSTATTAPGASTPPDGPATTTAPTTAAPAPPPTG